MSSCFYKLVVFNVVLVLMIRNEDVTAPVAVCLWCLSGEFNKNGGRGQVEVLMWNCFRFYFHCPSPAHSLTCPLCVSVLVLSCFTRSASIDEKWLWGKWIYCWKISFTNSALVKYVSSIYGNLRKSVNEFLIGLILGAMHARTSFNEPFDCYEK